MPKSHYGTVRTNIGEDDTEVTVKYVAHPGTPAVMYLRNGDPGYPAEPPECEFLSVTANGQAIELSDEDAKRITELCFDDANEQDQERDEEPDYPGPRGGEIDY